MKTTGLTGSEVLALIEQDKIVSCQRQNGFTYTNLEFNIIDFQKKINEVWSVTYKPIVITLEDVRWAWDFYLYLDCGDFDKSRFKEKLIERCTK